MLLELKSLFEKQARFERFDLIQTFHACKREEGKPAGSYVLKMKGYVEKLDYLGYVLPQDLSGKEKARGKKIKPVYIPEPKNPKFLISSSGKGYEPAYHHKEVGYCKRNCPAYLAELIMKKKQVGTASSSEVEGFEPPQEEEAPVCRSVRTHQAPECLCLNVEVEEHNLRDLNEPTNYKASMLDPQSDKWLDAMNAEMQYMKDNQVWLLVDLPPNAKGFYLNLHGCYEGTFSPVVTLELLVLWKTLNGIYVTSGSILEEKGQEYDITQKKS
ncbi:hypothetical protein Tco_0728080 [Tanacetum coccineum]|uniref:Uncharacterized protein n=1 Tax=Tanacetum coccineum TaxID=301880 RepID=A0ABQ4YK55_9ASTR